MRLRPNGMAVGRMRVPIGVIAIIYEARPNVTADATGLCLKSGNAVILRGGSEALHSNRATAAVLRDVARAEGLHEGAITFIDIPEREAVMEMLKLEGLIDLIIPRGGEGLIRAVTENSENPRASGTKESVMSLLTGMRIWQWRRQYVLIPRCKDPGPVMHWKQCSLTGLHLPSVSSQ